MVYADQQCLGAVGTGSGCRGEIEGSSAQGRLVREYELKSGVHFSPYRLRMLKECGDPLEALGVTNWQTRLRVRNCTIP